MDFSHLTAPKLREALKQAGVEVNFIPWKKLFVQLICLFVVCLFDFYVFCSIYSGTGSLESQQVCLGGLAQ